MDLYSNRSNFMLSNVLSEKYKKLRIFIKYVGIFVLFLILFNAKIDNTIIPFAFGFLFALMWSNQNVLGISLCYLVASMILTPSLTNLFVTVSTVAIMLLFFSFNKVIRKPMNVIVVGVYCLLSQIVFVYFNIGSLTQNINVGIHLFLGLLFLFASINILQVLILRGMYYKLTIDESICLMVFLAVISLGLSNVVAYEIRLSKIVAVFLILFLISINKSNHAIKCAIAFGVGMALFTHDLTDLGVLSLITLAGSIFPMPNRAKICVSILAIDVAVALYFVQFELHSLVYCLSSTIACIIYLILPSKLIYTVSDKFYLTENEISMRNVINITRKNLRRRMHQLSDIFLEMKQIHLGMLKQALSKEQVVAMLSNEVIQSVCGDCLEKNKCHRSLNGNTSNINMLIETALKKGKITLLDLPSSLTSRCGKVNVLVNKINQIISQYSQYSGMLNNVNNVKVLLAEQMGAVSKLLLDLGDEVDKNITFDTDRESKIMNKLLAQNIICSEIVLYMEKSDDISAMLVIKGDNSYSPLITQVVSEICGYPMKVQQILPTDNLDFMSVTLVKSNKYDIVFGLANSPKNAQDVSGDCHSILRLGNNKFLLALCDGMGSGEKAEKMSALTIGLIENFYKAGFENDLVLESVNKLLSVNDQETYSALDICLIDLEKEIADFIKVGAPFGIIKRKDSTEKIMGGALPMGILDNIIPSVYKTVISTQDMIIMCTDGITDAYKDVDSFVDFVNSQNNINPQTLAQSILDEAILRNELSIKDDMTVLVARTFLKDYKN